MDFKNAQELLELCKKENCTISSIMKKRECILSETTEEAITAQMDHSLKIMRESVAAPSILPKNPSED